MEAMIVREALIEAGIMAKGKNIPVVLVGKNLIYFC